VYGNLTRDTEMDNRHYRAAHTVQVAVAHHLNDCQVPTPELRAALQGLGGAEPSLAPAFHSLGGMSGAGRGLEACNSGQQLLYVKDWCSMTTDSRASPRSTCQVAIQQMPTHAHVQQTSDCDCQRPVLDEPEGLAGE
jgi:hypothetical protein